MNGNRLFYDIWWVLLYLVGSGENLVIGKRLSVISKSETETEPESIISTPEPDSEPSIPESEPESEPSISKPVSPEVLK